MGLATVGVAGRPGGGAGGDSLGMSKQGTPPVSPAGAGV